MTAPIAFELIEDAISQWLQLSVPGITVYFVEPEDSGAPHPAPPRVQILPVAGPVALSRPELRRIPSVMSQRVTVTAGGPATAGVDFRLGFAEQPERIEVDLLVGDDPEAGAAKLLGELVLELPAGVTAALDPEDVPAILVTGSGFSTSDPRATGGWSCDYRNQSTEGDIEVVAEVYCARPK